jgi:hypothetical protein
LKGGTASADEQQELQASLRSLVAGVRSRQWAIALQETLTSVGVKI